MRRITLAFVAMLGLCVVPASAATITFSYSGTIDTVGVYDPAFIDDPTGTLFTGQYTFESTAPDLIGSAEQGSYAGTSLSLTLSNQTFNFSPMAIGVSDLTGPPLDQYLVSFFDMLTSFSIRLEDAQGGAFSSDALPLSAPGLAPFETRFFFFQLADDNFNTLVDVNGTLTSLECISGCTPDVSAPVPEPATLLLVPSGLAALALATRRRRQPR